MPLAFAAAAHPPQNLTDVHEAAAAEADHDFWAALSLSLEAA